MWKFVRGVPLFVTAQLVLAHAVMVKSDPPAGASIAGPVIPVALQFNSRVDARRSKIAMVTGDKEEQLVIGQQPSPDTVTTEIRNRKPGPCKLKWQVLASDGHITRGEFSFQVK